MRSLVLLTCLAVSPAGLACKAQQDAPEPSAHSAPSVVLVPAGHLRMVAASAAGDVRAMVHDATDKAAREKRRLVVYVGATWCEPCQKFCEAAERGELDPVLGNVTLLEFDLDRDGERLRSAGYASQYIPLFALPAADGTASGKQIEGAIKGDGAVAFVVPRLARLLAE